MLKSKINTRLNIDSQLINIQFLANLKQLFGFLPSSCLDEGAVSYFVCLHAGLLDCLLGYLVAYLVGWLLDSLVSWLLAFIAWLIGWLVG